MNAKKIILIAGIIILLLAIVGFTVNQTQKNVVTVQTGKVAKQDIVSLVTASGEIKPLTYVNVGANAMGRISRLLVKEGDPVKKGQIVAQLENVQPAADVANMKATLESSQTDAVALDAALKTALAQTNSSKANLAQAKLEWDRAQSLYKDQLIAKSDYDTKRAAYEVADAAHAQDQARVAQARANLDSAQGHINQARATLTRVSDVLSKTTYIAPFNGVVTSLPVREGETVVMGIQNSLGSVLMTIADMSVITAEVHVDETDIGRVKMGMPSVITLDSYPNAPIQGTVFQILYEGVNTSNVITYGVKIEPKNVPPFFRSQMTANISLIANKKDNVVLLPEAAIQPSASGERQVMVPGPDGKPTARTVQVGLETGDQAEITNGLADGETVLIVRKRYAPQQAASQSPLVMGGPKNSQQGQGGGGGGRRQ